MACLFTSFLINVLVGREDLVMYTNLLHLMGIIKCINSLFHMKGTPFVMIAMCCKTSISFILTIQLLVVKETFTLKKEL